MFLDDSSSCLSCGSQSLDTSSISPTYGYCTCSGANSSAVVEKDVSGNLLSNATCSICPSGQIVIHTTTSYAGVVYEGDPSLCRSCPDINMRFVLTGSTYACVCKNGYTLVGSELLGAQSCVTTALANAYTATEATAVNMNIYIYINRCFNSFIFQ